MTAKSETPPRPEIDWKDPDYSEIWNWRGDLLRKMRKSRAALDAVNVYYKRNPVDWINDWINAYDPRRSAQGKSATVPFVLWPRQVELVHWLVGLIRREEDGLIEKSREEGASFLCSALALHHWRFFSGFKAGFGSRKESLVDRKGDMDSIFEKIRHMLTGLPEEMLPVGFDLDRHANHLKIRNPENGSSITGEGGDNIGRGGRNTVYFLDESAFLEHSQLVDAALSQNTKVRIDLSTPNGVGNSFYRRRFELLQPHQIFELDWRHDPRKSKEWYEAECKRIGDPIIVARELDRDYDAGAQGIVCPGEWVRSAIDFDFAAYGLSQPTGRIEAGLDVADGGPDTNALVIRQGPKILYIEEWPEGDTSQTTQRALSACKRWGVDILRYDSIGVGAGVRGELNRLKKAGRVPFKVVGVNVGKLPSLSLFFSKPAREIFKNARAELWWRLRARFEHTHAVAEKREKPDIERLISIPEDLSLVAEISAPQYDFTNNGLIIIESKKHMREQRGINSPNKADAVCLAFARTNIIRL